MDTDLLHKMIDVLAGRKENNTEKLPVSMLMDEHSRWLKATNKTLSATTMAGRNTACRKFVSFVESSYPSASNAEDVDRRCALAFAEFLDRQGAKSKTRRNNIADLGAVWMSLIRIRDGITSNPWTLVLPQVSDDYERGVPFTREDERKVIEAADVCGYGWGLACRIALYTGLRYGDTATLRWRDIDLDTGVISVTPSKTRRHKVSLRIPINKALSKAIMERLKEAGKPSPDDFILPELGNRIQGRCKPPCTFARVLSVADVESGKYTFHSWRRTFRTRLAEAGVSDEIARRLGGWTNDGMALHYDHDGRLADLRNAVDKI